MAQTLLDPHDMAEDDIDELNEKLRVAKMIIARSPEKGGSPFIYAFSATKPHFLEDISMPLYTDKDGTEHKFYSAATDGKKYMWHPEMLRRLTPREIGVVMCHETYHIVLQHTDPNRCLGKNMKVWNIAVDYVVNSMIEHDQRQSGRISSYSNYGIDNHPIWTGNLGRPLPYDELLAAVKETYNDWKGSKKSNAKKVKNKKKKSAPKGPPKPEDIRMYCDYKQYGKSSEDIYDEIMQYVKEMDDELLQMILDALGAGNPDDHSMPGNISRQDLLQEVLDAVAATKQLCGTVPSAIEDHLTKLQEPKLSWQDIIRNTLQFRRQEKGRVNDWGKFKRRSVSLNIQPGMKGKQEDNPFYIPRKKDDFVTWLALLDTSGSMSVEDMSYGISQLKCLDGRSEGLVVCCDAQTYWDKATRISRMSDLPTINPVGRGGTVFEDFFRDYRKMVGSDWDVIVVMTDGGIWDIEKLIRPHCDVVWVLTNKWEEFNPPWGRVAPFRSF
jgi:predicted metal-dependent peptidase